MDFQYNAEKGQFTHPETDVCIFAEDMPWELTPGAGIEVVYIAAEFNPDWDLIPKEDLWYLKALPEGARVVIDDKTLIKQDDQFIYGE